MDLRLTIPAAAPFRAAAAELTEKFAAYLGAEAAAAKSLAAQTEAAIAPIAEAQPDQPIDMQLSANGRELVVTAHSGSMTGRSSCPLPD